MFVSWFDREKCSKVIAEGTIAQNTYDFLLAFYSYSGHISCCFSATVDSMQSGLAERL